MASSLTGALSMVRKGDLLQLAVPASALALLSLDPAPAAVSRVLGLLQSQISLSTLKQVLKVGVVYSVAKVVNRFLNAFALNNWRLPSTQNWKWGSEIAVVTGGCGGIGKSIVIGLAEKGLKVAILDMADFPEDLAALGNVHYWKCDISSAPAVAEAAAAIREKLGNPSILVNNAGIAQEHSILETSDAGLRKMFEVNIVAQWTTTREFLPAMIAQNKGHIVAVSSMSAHVTMGLSVDYAATKAGILSFHQGLQAELKNVYKAPGVMSTIVHPMWVRTGMTQKRAAKSEKKRKAMMTPEEVAGKVLDQLYSCRGGQIILPEKVTWLTGINGFPNWVQEAIRDFAVKSR